MTDTPITDTPLTDAEPPAYDGFPSTVRREFARKLERMIAEAYGRGVSAGKAEALAYTPEERERYGRWVAQTESKR